MDLAAFEQHRATVRTPAGEISYVAMGEGKPALFVHGVAVNSALWRNVMPELAGERRCIALDLPAHGLTPGRTDHDYSLPMLAETVEALCAELGLTDLDLVANDTGGAVAQIFAVNHRERLDTLTLTDCDTDGNFPPRALAPVAALAKARLLAAPAAALARASAVRRGLLAVGYENPKAVPEDVVDSFVEPVLGTRQRARELQHWLAALDNAHLEAITPRLRELDVPTLVVWGTKDLFFAPVWGRRLRDTIPGSTLVEVPGGKLFFPDERAAELVGHLRGHWHVVSA